MHVEEAPEMGVLHEAHVLTPSRYQPSLSRAATEVRAANLRSRFAQLNLTAKASLKFCI